MASGNAEQMENNAGEIGVYDENDNPIRDFTVETISISRLSKIIGTPVETGSKRFDNKVLDPKVITVVGYVNVYEGDREAENRFRQMYESREYKFYKVVGKGSGGENLYENLMLQNYKTTEDPEKFELVHVTLEFLEVWISDQEEEKKPANSDDSKTVDQGDSSPPISGNQKRLGTLRNLGIIE